MYPQTINLHETPVDPCPVIYIETMISIPRSPFITLPTNITTSHMCSNMCTVQKIQRSVCLRSLAYEKQLNM